MATLTALLSSKLHRDGFSTPVFHTPTSEGRNDVNIYVDLHTEWLQDTIRRVLMNAAASNETCTDVIVAYLSDNSPHLLTNLLACIDLTTKSFPNTANGIIPAMMNVRWTPLEISRVLSPKHSSNNDGDSVDNDTLYITLLLYGDEYKGTAAETVNNINNATKKFHLAVALPIPNFTSALPRFKKMDCTRIGSQYSHAKPEASNKDAILLFTSGTSSVLGVPKGVRLSHRSLFVQALAKTQSPCRYDEKTVVAANTVPIFHIGGLSSLLAVLLGGGSLLFPHNIDIGSKSRGFRPEMVLSSLNNRGTTDGFTGVNTLVVVPAMLHSIYEYVGKAKGGHGTRTFPHVRLILVGGQSIGSGHLYIQTRQHFPNARIVQTYACTEAGSSITFEDLGHNENSGIENSRAEVAVAGATCVGLPPPHIQVGIFGPDKLSLPKGNMGIIGTRGTHTMSGYWNRGESSRHQATETVVNAWMFTSDLGYIDVKTNKLYFCGRANDVIRTGGESVLATEVEKVIGFHPEISEIAVFGLPNEKYGEIVCAAAVSKKTSSPGLVENDELKRSLRRHCTEHHLAGYKHPRRVFCMQSLPRNSLGKVLKQQIIEACSQLLTLKSRL